MVWLVLSAWSNPGINAKRLLADTQLCRTAQTEYDLVRPSAAKQMARVAVVATMLEEVANVEMPRRKMALGELYIGADGTHPTAVIETMRDIQAIQEELRVLAVRAKAMGLDAEIELDRASSVHSMRKLSGDRLQHVRDMCADFYRQTERIEAEANALLLTKREQVDQLVRDLAVRMSTTPNIAPADTTPPIELRVPPNTRVFY